jgi:hypothetical protein
VLALRDHEIKVAGKARIADISGRVSLGGPPDPEKAVSLASGAMVVDAFRSNDGRVQLPGPAFCDAPVSTQDLEKILRASSHADLGLVKRTIILALVL